MMGERKKGMSKAEIRRVCRDYAARFIDIQREEFKRLGVLATWDSPYGTMDYEYQGTIVREFGKFVEGGYLYKGKKPVYWCATCHTALAEAEVEYVPHRSFSIFVKFPMISDIEKTFPSLQGKKVSVIIWTTTPWTIPANLAVALHPAYKYVAAEANGEVYIVAEGLADMVMHHLGMRNYRVLETFAGSALEGLKSSHPFLNRESVIIRADYVTLEAGTGCVHTAPGHGQEDYERGLKYGVGIYAPEDACSSIEHAGFREKALKGIDAFEWIPAWGRERIYGMVANRPDWCVSRQRVWGVPIVAFYCEGCGEILLRKDVIDFVADRFEEEGADIWFDEPAEQLLPYGPGA